MASLEEILAGGSSESSSLSGGSSTSGSDRRGDRWSRDHRPQVGPGQPVL